MDSAKLIDDNSLIHTAGLPAQDLPDACLYIVGLPIGNLGDITLRALWVLNHVDIVAAEDTRQSRKVLEKFNISVPLCCVHQHNEHEGAEELLGYLREGKRVALVTDAGTPAVSDPGSKVVKTVRDNGFRVIPIPGCSAVVTAMSAAGMAPEGFIFHGFLEGGKVERSRMIAELASTGRTFVLYEAPHRICKLAQEIAETLEDERRVVVARELTKKFETLESMQSTELAAWAKSHRPLGEYVVIVNAKEEKCESSLDGATQAWISKLAEHLPTGLLASVAAEISCTPKKQIYDTILAIKQNHAE